MFGFAFCFVLLGGSGFLLLFVRGDNPSKCKWVWGIKLKSLRYPLTSSKHFKSYFGLRKDLGVEEERSTAHLHSITKFHASLHNVSRLTLPPRRSMGAGTEPERAMVLDTVCCLRMWCLALLFNRYKDNVPRFPGTCKTLYFLSLELWTMIRKALFIPTQITPQVSHPNPPPAEPLSMQTGRIIPFKKHIILFHLHQYVSQSHVAAAAWDCPSVLFSKASVARTTLSQSLLNICSFFMCLFGNVVVIPVTQCMDEKQNKTKRICI